MRPLDVVEEWILDSEQGETFRAIREQIDLLEEWLYSDFEPCPYGNFRERLDLWIKNLPDNEDKKILFKLVPQLCFVGRDEFDALYRHAYRTVYYNWVTDTAISDFFEENAALTIDNELERTWFCPITDSMRINGFYHSNSIEGKDIRPDWKSLSKLGDKKRISDYIRKKKIKRLVLLEDFVGSGTQMKEAAIFASQFNLNVLALPLLCCPEGLEAGKELAKKYNNLSFRPAVTLPASAFVRTYRTPGEIELAPEIRRIAHSTCAMVQGQEITEGPCPSFGFKGAGALVVMYSNCPNNSLPILHEARHGWKALFPRTKRL